MQSESQSWPVQEKLQANGVDAGLQANGENRGEEYHVEQEKNLSANIHENVQLLKVACHNGYAEANRGLARKKDKKETMEYHRSISLPNLYEKKFARKETERRPTPLPNHKKQNIVKWLDDIMFEKNRDQLQMPIKEHENGHMGKYSAFGSTLLEKRKLSKTTGHLTLQDIVEEERYSMEKESLMNGKHRTKNADEEQGRQRPFRKIFSHSCIKLGALPDLHHKNHQHELSKQKENRTWLPSINGE